MLSIAQHMEPEDIFAEIVMERQAHKGSFLLLEGTHDIKRLEKFLVDDCSTVNCWGKTKLLKAVDLIDDAAFEGALAVADADFDRILNSLRTSPNLIYSDTHDLDLDCISSGALPHYLNEVADPNKLSALGGAGDVAKKHLEGIAPISCARLANRKGLIQVSLADIDWSQCFTPFSVNRSMYAAKALKKLSPTRADIEAMVAVMMAEEAAQPDLWQITNGHDFCVAIGISLQDALGSRSRQQTTGGEIELHLRLGYQKHHFHCLGVAKRIKQWEAANQPYLILA